MKRWQPALLVGHADPGSADFSRRCIHRPGSLAFFLDSTANLTRSNDAGTAGNNAPDNILGRYRGGFGTKLHAVAETSGNLLEFVLIGR
jgi:hypothetical protein